MSSAVGEGRATFPDPIAAARDALPELPLSSAHQDEKGIRRWHRDWVYEHGLVTTDEEWTHVDAQRFPILAAHFYPLCRTEEDARLASAWLTFFHLYDDLFDVAPLSHDPPLAQATVDRALELVASAQRGDVSTYEPTEPLLAALASLLTWTLEPMGASWREPFLNELRRWLESYVDETRHRANGTVLTAENLIVHKRACMAVPPCTLLFERVHLGEVVPVVREALSPLVDLASDLTGAINDMVSFEKERECGDTHNLVAAFMQHEGMSEREALAEIAHWIIERAAEMRHAIATLPRQPALATHRAIAARWAEACGAFVRGYYEWILVSGRHPAAHALRTEQTATLATSA